METMRKGSIFAEASKHRLVEDESERRQHVHSLGPGLVKRTQARHLHSPPSSFLLRVRALFALFVCRFAMPSMFPCKCTQTKKSGVFVIRVTWHGTACARERESRNANYSFLLRGRVKGKKVEIGFDLGRTQHNAHATFFTVHSNSALTLLPV